MFPVMVALLARIEIPAFCDHPPADFGLRLELLRLPFLQRVMRVVADHLQTR